MSEPTKQGRLRQARERQRIQQGREQATIKAGRGALVEFGAALVDHAKGTVKHVNQAIRQARQEICAECEHYRPKSCKRCALCGCRIPWKIGWASSECKDNPPRWPAITE